VGDGDGSGGELFCALYADCDDDEEYDGYDGMVGAAGIVGTTGRCVGCEAGAGQEAVGTCMPGTCGTVSALEASVRDEPAAHAPGPATAPPPPGGPVEDEEDDEEMVETVGGV